MHWAVNKIISCSPGPGGGCHGYPEGCAEEVHSGKEELLDWFRLASGMLPCNKGENVAAITNLKIFANPLDQFVLQNNIRIISSILSALSRNVTFQIFIYLKIGQKLRLQLALLFSHLEHCGCTSGKSHRSNVVLPPTSFLICSLSFSSHSFSCSLPPAQGLTDSVLWNEAITRVDLNWKIFSFT